MEARDLKKSKCPVANIVVTEIKNLRDRVRMASLGVVLLHGNKNSKRKELWGGS